jgi:hypothetical protein
MPVFKRFPGRATALALLLASAAPAAMAQQATSTASTQPVGISQSSCWP